MYGCWVYPFNYEEYLKKEEEIDSIIKGFGEEEFAFDEDEFEPLDEAYIVEIDIEAYGEEYKGHYFVAIGSSFFSYDALEETICGLDPEYKKHLELKGREYSSFTEEEKAVCFVYAEKFAMIEGNELGDEFEELLDGEDVSCGKIIKKIF